MKKDTNAYMNYVCPYCFNTLDNCICELFPPYHLMFIDRGIQEHIRILNGKGYKTTGCCESHYKGTCTCIYISFGIEYGFGESIMLPEEFKFDKRKRSIVYDYKRNISEEQMNATKATKLYELLKWCENLPELPKKSYY